MEGGGGGGYTQCYINILVSLFIMSLLGLHPHPSSFVSNSVNEDILLVEDDVNKLA